MSPSSSLTRGVCARTRSCVPASPSHKLTPVLDVLSIQDFFGESSAHRPRASLTMDSALTGLPLLKPFVRDGTFLEFRQGKHWSGHTSLHMREMERICGAFTLQVSPICRECTAWKRGGRRRSDCAELSTRGGLWRQQNELMRLTRCLCFSCSIYLYRVIGCYLALSLLRRLLSLTPLASSRRRLPPSLQRAHNVLVKHLSLSPFIGESALEPVSIVPYPHPLARWTTIQIPLRLHGVVLATFVCLNLYLAFAQYSPLTQDNILYVPHFLSFASLPLPPSQPAANLAFSALMFSSQLPRGRIPLPTAFPILCRPYSNPRHRYNAPMHCSRGSQLTHQLAHRSILLDSTNLSPCDLKGDVLERLLPCGSVQLPHPRWRRSRRCGGLAEARATALSRMGMGRLLRRSGSLYCLLATPS